MIEGVVTSDREATLRIVIRGPQNHEQEIEAIVDTGFTDYLTLSPNLVASLGLSFAAPAPVTLADGSEVLLNYYRATVVWDGVPRNVFVFESDGGPLVGMAMLYGYELLLPVLDGATFTIRAISHS